MAIFEGAGVALVTPFAKTGEINYEKLEELVEEQIMPLQSGQYLMSFGCTSYHLEEIGRAHV